MDSLGDRMKIYEGIEANRKLIPNLPICVRIDGKSFSSWTKGCDRPFDTWLQDLFDETTKFLVDKTNAVVGYCQSDEISLILWNYEQPESEVMFNGRTQKLTSILASLCTAKFNSLVSQYYENKPLAFFDCRVWNVPSPDEAINCLVWREQDATRNSIQMTAQSLYSHKELHQKNSSQLQEMIWQKGINWNDYPSRFKRGAYFNREKIVRKLTVLERTVLPEKHLARQNPNLEVIRHEVKRLELPPITQVVNRSDVIFYKAIPILKDIKM